MKLRQAKKIMGWCKGDGNWRSKDHRKSFWKRCEELRPSYHDDRGRYVQPSCHDIDIIRRAHTRLFRWIRKGKSLRAQQGVLRQGLQAHQVGTSEAHAVLIKETTNNTNITKHP